MTARTAGSREVMSATSSWSRASTASATTPSDQETSVLRKIVAKVELKATVSTRSKAFSFRQGALARGAKHQDDRGN